MDDRGRHVTNPLTSPLVHEKFPETGLAATNARGNKAFYIHVSSELVPSIDHQINLSIYYFIQSVTGDNVLHATIRIVG